MSQRITAEKTLAKLQKGESMFYNAGLNGEAFAIFPNLTAATTAEEEAQMIENAVDKCCAEHGNISNTDFRETIQLMYEIFIGSYRDGLSAKEKDHSTEKESA